MHKHMYVCELGERHARMHGPLFPLLAVIFLSLIAKIHLEVVNF